jgi:hypothetical protein
MGGGITDAVPKCSFIVFLKTSSWYVVFVAGSVVLRRPVLFATTVCDYCLRLLFATTVETAITSTATTSTATTSTATTSTVATTVGPHTVGTRHS